MNVPPDAPVAYSRLNDRYQILSIVGRGGMASVYKARDEFLDREVAVKLFDASLGDTAEAARQEHELQVLAKLNHHSLVSLIDAGIVRRTDPGLSRMFLVMEFISGSTLKTLAVKEKLSGREIAHIGFDLAEGLEYIHRQGVIHRDIKPANVLMVDYGSGTERRRAKLADFGIALLARNAAADASSTTGTSAYLSPEQAMRDTVGPASDVYSLGLTLIECFSRTLAFPGTHLETAVGRLTRDPEVPADLPTPWRDLLTAMTAREPSVRPTSSQLVATLGELIGFERAREAKADLPTPVVIEMRPMPTGRLPILDRPADPAFDRIANLARRIFDVPVAIVMAAEDDQVWVASHVGVDAERLRRRRGVQAADVFGGQLDANPIVTGDEAVRFSASAPLRSADGTPLGSIAILDYVPRELSSVRRQSLDDLAAFAVTELELRAARR